jgi:ATP-dependent Clp protease protease subunit
MSQIEPFSSLRDSGIFLLFGEISMESSKDIISWILEMNISLGVKHTNQKLTLIINSTGGDISTAFAIIDIMRGSSIPVHTVGIGQLCSAALMIFMAGSYRVLTPNTSIMSHVYTWGVHGSHHDLVSVQFELHLMIDRMMSHYRECTKLEDNKIREHLLTTTDTWLSADQALDLNVCDEIKVV